MQKQVFYESHSRMTLLFSSNDSKNAEHNLLSGGILLDEPLNIVSHGLSVGTDGATELSIVFSSNGGNSP